MDCITWNVLISVKTPAAARTPLCLSIAGCDHRPGGGEGAARRGAALGVASATRCCRCRNARPLQLIYSEEPLRKPLTKAPAQGASAIHRIRLDTYVGMAFSNIVALAIMVTTAATLHAAGITNIESSSQAAEALKPVAGAFAFAIFALGIVGTGLLAVPVLAGSAAYGVGEARKYLLRMGPRGPSNACFHTLRPS
jgi:hypothetical protein